MILDDEDDPSPEELREAELLARALGAGEAPPGAPLDALETGALLRYAKDDALDPARYDGALEHALASVDRRRRTRRITTYGTLMLAAAAVVLWMRSAPISDEHALPPPPRALLEAQLDAASSSHPNLARLAVWTSDYRATVYENIRERYSK